MTDELPVWAVAPGIPSRHAALAALHAASIIDRRGSPVSDARESYWHHATGGYFPPPDLHRGERLLVDCHLVVERDGVLYPTAELDHLLDGNVEDATGTLCVLTLAATQSPADAPPATALLDQALAELVPDAARREEMLLALGRRFDAEFRQTLGNIGEELVVQAAREELEWMGRDDLARRVRRVSLESDQLGYDITAPRTAGSPRLLEVKATTADIGDTVVIHVSRNEIDTGRRFADWSLVVCRITDIEGRSGDVVGWCVAQDLLDSVPADTDQGRWEQAQLTVPTSALRPDLPRAVV